METLRTENKWETDHCSMNMSLAEASKIVPGLKSPFEGPDMWYPGFYAYHTCKFEDLRRAIAEEREVLVAPRPLKDVWILKGHVSEDVTLVCTRKKTEGFLYSTSSAYFDEHHQVQYPRMRVDFDHVDQKERDLLLTGKKYARIHHIMYDSKQMAHSNAIYRRALVMKDGKNAFHMMHADHVSGDRCSMNKVQRQEVKLNAHVDRLELVSARENAVRSHANVFSTCTLEFVDRASVSIDGLSGNEELNTFLRDEVDVHPDVQPEAGGIITASAVRCLFDDRVRPSTKFAETLEKGNVSRWIVNGFVLFENGAFSREQIDLLKKQLIASRPEQSYGNSKAWVVVNMLARETRFVVGKDEAHEMMMGFVPDDPKSKAEMASSKSNLHEMGPRSTWVTKYGCIARCLNKTAAAESRWIGKGHAPLDMLLCDDEDKYAALLDHYRRVQRQKKMR